MFVVPTDCEPGYFSETCTPCGNCLRGEVCNSTTGVCPNGCTAGWEGDTCDQGKTTPIESSLSHRCVFAPRTGHEFICETSHVLLAGVSGGFSPGTPVFAPPTD